MENRSEDLVYKTSIIPFFGQCGLVYFILTASKDKIAYLRTCVNIISRRGFVAFPFMIDSYKLLRSAVIFKQTEEQLIS